MDGDTDRGEQTPDVLAEARLQPDLMTMRSEKRHLPIDYFVFSSALPVVVVQDQDLHGVGLWALAGLNWGALEAELELSSPIFLAVHFALPHYPYHWADAPRYQDDGTAHRGQTLYRETISRADAQVGELLELLRAKGALENALVVLLSDHGEGLGGSDDLLLTDATREIEGYRIPAMASGHGTSVLSPPQYQVLLAVRGFGAAALSGLPPARSDTPASLEDVMPTLLELQGLTVADATGRRQRRIEASVTSF